ncbi:hypothetical protein GW17_00014724 [Ensete ventricosum]|uniref:Uncharacterized protein n=1 Tax=Ensete ventricosum TaxID=4639 RepID=A0A426YHX0_ENSVE|nr:hypothetical protein B296_00049067 [Ensete ventricosum]RWW21130.1 hypothetical protein GW17_00014724 [Ensete ventricosum]RZR91613.1 hypothetical protein BHM03_00019778 [Ensete ventricosum]
MSTLRLWTMEGREPSQVVKGLDRSPARNIPSRHRSGDEEGVRRRRRGREDEIAMSGDASRERRKEGGLALG